MRSQQAAFTLIELLVVITIIVVLLALLAPALDRAIEQAERVVCLANQRNIVQSALFYAQDQNKWLPPGSGSAFDLRAGTMQGNLGVRPGALDPAGLGLAVTTRHLPATQLGKVIHCPSLNTEGAGPPWLGIVDIKYWGMDRVGQIHVGGSYWVDPAYEGYRLVASFNYRAASYSLTGKGRLRLGKLGPGLLLSVDFPDPRMGIHMHHRDGYNRVFADGHGGYFHDPTFEVEKMAEGSHVDGHQNPVLDEEIYEYMAADR